MIAMALSLSPQLLIADEPTTALDVTTQAQILKLIKRIQAEREMSVLFITHDFGVVADMADRVAVMRHGRVVESGTVGEVLGNPVPFLYPRPDRGGAARRKPVAAAARGAAAGAGRRA